MECDVGPFDLFISDKLIREDIRSREVVYLADFFPPPPRESHKEDNRYPIVEYQEWNDDWKDFKWLRI